MIEVTPRMPVVHDGRPAIVITRPEVGATGRLIVGIKYADVPGWEPVPGHPDVQQPVRGSSRIVAVEDLEVAP